MTDNFKNPVDYVENHPIICKSREKALLRLYKRGKGCGNGIFLGDLFIEDCAECRGDGREYRYLFWIFPVNGGPCGACNGMGRVICGEADKSDKPGLYGIRGYDEEHAAQEESKQANEWPPRGA